MSGRSLSAFFLHKPANLLAFSYAEKEEPEKLRAYETLEKNHGRIEKRKHKISQDIDYLTGKENWKGLKSIGKVVSIREIDGKRSTETRYYILDQEMTSEEMSHIVRGHWEIENSLHWVLDVHFREDACKIKAEKAMQNLSLSGKSRQRQYPVPLHIQTASACFLSNQILG